MPAVITKYSRYVGDDYVIQHSIYEEDGVTPVDINGWSLLFAFHSINSLMDVVSKTTGGHGIVINSPTNVPPQATTTILKADTLNLSPGFYQFRLERTDSGDDDVLTNGIHTLLVK